MKAIIRFLLSLKTAFALFLLSLVIYFIGSLSLPKNLAFFSGIDDTPLFRWLSDSGHFNITWWIYALIAMLGLLAVSTIFCTAEALLKRLGKRNIVSKLSPQIMHIGVLFILLGHLLTASLGIKTDLVIRKGEEKQITKGMSVSVEDVHVRTDANGYFTDWETKLSWKEDGQVTESGVLRPVHPLYFGKFGVYSKSVTMEPEVSVQVRVCRDPGVAWALLGGLLLSIGGLGFIYAKIRPER